MDIGTIEIRARAAQYLSALSLSIFSIMKHQKCLPMYNTESIEKSHGLGYLSLQKGRSSMELLYKDEAIQKSQGIHSIMEHQKCIIILAHVYL